MIELDINGKKKQLTVAPDAPLLWVVRELLGLTGSKFGCGKGLCGACTMHLNGQAVRTCVLPVSAAIGQKITTIEGITSDGDLHPVQQAWIAENVPQCGYCQSGQIMSALALLKQHPSPDDQAIENAMHGNICRCGTYPRIRKAIKRAAKSIYAEAALLNTQPATTTKENIPSEAKENTTGETDLAVQFFHPEKAARS